MNIDIATEARKLIAKRLKRPIEEVVDAANLTDDLGAESLDAVELSFDVEDHFDVEITDEELAQLKTVGQVIALVQGKMGEINGHARS